MQKFVGGRTLLPSLLKHTIPAVESEKPRKSESGLEEEATCPVSAHNEWDPLEVCNSNSKCR